jgi:hypothetical protein
MIDRSKEEAVPIHLEDDIADALMKSRGIASDQLLEHIKVAGMKAGISEKDQGPVFIKGEEIEIKGVKFKVAGIGKKEIVFRMV